MGKTEVVTVAPGETVEVAPSCHVSVDHNCDPADVTVHTAEDGTVTIDL